MNLISIRKKRRPAIALLLCTGLLGACPPDAVADAGDRLPVPEIQQSKSPVKRTLVGTVTDASTGETLIGVNVIILKSASNLNGNLNCSKELEHYAS